MTTPTLRDVAEALVRWHDSLTWAYCPTCSAEGDHFDTCPVGMARLALSTPAPSEDVAGLAGGWVRVEDWLPELGEEVLACSPGECVAVCYRSTLGWDSEYGPRPDVTHWRPLPEPPEVG